MNIGIRPAAADERDAWIPRGGEERPFREKPDRFAGIQIGLQWCLLNGTKGEGHYDKRRADYSGPDTHCGFTEALRGNLGPSIG